jgi:hypothetical protein
VKLGHVDICVGDFWETTERRQLAPMTASMAIDIFQLVSRSTEEGKSTIDFFASIFMPFDNNVWGLCVPLSPLIVL